MAAKLALQQKVWDLKLAREREKRRDKEASRFLTNSTPRGNGYICMIYICMCVLYIYVLIYILECRIFNNCYI